MVGESLGVDVEFVEIDLDNKIMELKSKNIDVVWNGMTLTDEVKNYGMHQCILQQWTGYRYGGRV